MAQLVPMEVTPFPICGLILLHNQRPNLPAYPVENGVKRGWYCGLFQGNLSLINRRLGWFEHSIYLYFKSKYIAGVACRLYGQVNRPALGGKVLSYGSPWYHAATSLPAVLLWDSVSWPVKAFCRIALFSSSMALSLSL